MPPAAGRPEGAIGPDDEDGGADAPLVARRPRLPAPPGGPDRDGPTDVADTLGLRLEAITLRLEGLRAASTSQASAVSGALREQANTVDRLTEEMSRLAERQRVAGADLAEQISSIDDRLSKVTLSLVSSPHLLDDLSESISDELTRRVSEQLSAKVAQRLGKSDADQRQLLSAVRDATAAASAMAEEAQATTLAARQLARVAVDGLNSFGEQILDALEERYGVQLDADGGGIAQSAFPRLADGVAGLTAELRELRDDVAEFVESEAGRGSAQMQRVGNGVASLATELRRLQGDITDLVGARVATSESALASVADDVAVLTAELRQIHGDIAELADGLSDMDDTAITGVAESVAALGTELRQLQGDVGELGEARANGAEAADMAIAGVAASVAALTAELRQLHGDVGELGDAQASTAEAADTAIVAVAESVSVLAAELQELRGDVAEVAEALAVAVASPAAPAAPDGALAGLQAELVAIRRRLPMRGKEPKVTLDPSQFEPLVDAIMKRLVSIADVVEVPPVPAGRQPRGQADGAAPGPARRSRRPDA